MGSDLGDSTPLDVERLRAARRQSRALRQLSQQAIARARATCDQARMGRSQREVLHDSRFARLLAKQETMPVIEQAKGIVMVQQGCGPEEAFDLLRRASQQTNVKLRELAAQIVGLATSPGKRGNVTPITLGATRRLRPGNAGTATTRR